MGFRLFCCSVIVSCSVLFGLSMRHRLFLRLQSLEYFREYFRSVRTYISHVGMSLDEIVLRLDTGDSCRQFSRLLGEKCQQSSFPSAFSDSLLCLKESLCLTDADIHLLSSVADKLSFSDLDGALEYLGLADEQLLSLIESAEMSLKSDGRLYVVLSISCGSVAALLLL